MDVSWISHGTLIVFFIGRLYIGLSSKNVSNISYYEKNLILPNTNVFLISILIEIGYFRPDFVTFIFHTGYFSSKKNYLI